MSNREDKNENQILVLNNKNDHSQTDKSDDGKTFGWYCFRPSCLQRFNSPGWFVFFFSFCIGIDALISPGLLSVSVPEIEKEFGFRSEDSGLIMSSSDITGILLITFVSYFGERGHKPKILGLGIMTTACGSLLMVLPKLIAGKYKPAIFYEDEQPSLCPASPLNTTLKECNGNVVTSTTFYLALFVAARLVYGIGLTPLYTLGPAFIDENVAPKKTPIYLGIFYGTLILGPGFGFIVGGIFIRKYTNLSIPAESDLSLSDPRWVGAWWLAFLVFSLMLFAGGIVILGYPKQFPQINHKRKQAMLNGDIKGANKELKNNLKGMLKSFKELLSNKMVLFAMIAGALGVSYSYSIAGFFPKIFVTKFGLTTSFVGLVIGAVCIPAMSGGIVIGSVFMRKVKLKSSCEAALCFCAFAALLLTLLSIGWLIPGCRDDALAGVTVPYTNMSEIGGQLSKCNFHCNCLKNEYNPVCGSDGISYFSPCLAGCSGMNDSMQFVNCSCIGGSGVDVSFPQNAAKGLCDRNCKNFGPFLVIVIASVTCMFITAVPHQMILLRGVAENIRSFTTGLNILIIKLSKYTMILFGYLIDVECSLWKHDSCGKRSNCLMYNLTNLSKNIAIFACTFTGMSGILFMVSYRFSTKTETVAQLEISENDGENTILDGLENSDKA